MSRAFDDEVALLRHDVERVLSGALASERGTSELLEENIDRVADAHADDQALFDRALATRDLIGQAKGIIMVTTRCDADAAFTLLRRQSQHENRKLVDVATEIVDRVVDRARPDR